MIYGYMRVSTVGQVKGNSLEEQERILRQNGAVILYQDAFTGTKTSRPNFNKLLEILQEGDTLVITKLVGSPAIRWRASMWCSIC